MFAHDEASKSSIEHLQSEYNRLANAIGLSELDQLLHRRNVVNVCTKQSMGRLSKLVRMMQEQYKLMNAVLHAINLRETALKSFLKGCVHKMNPEECTVDKHIQGATHLREIDHLTVKVVLAIHMWRKALTKPFPFIFRGENYLLKIVHDAPILKCAVFHLNAYARDILQMMGYFNCPWSKLTTRAAASVSDRTNFSSSMIVPGTETCVVRDILLDETPLQIEMCTDLLQLAQRGFFLPTISFNCSPIIQRAEPILFPTKHDQLEAVMNYSSGLVNLRAPRKLAWSLSQMDLTVVADRIAEGHRKELCHQYFQRWLKCIRLLRDMENIRRRSMNLLAETYFRKWLYVNAIRRGFGRKYMLEFMVRCFPKPTTNNVVTYERYVRPLALLTKEHEPEDAMMIHVDYFYELKTILRNNFQSFMTQFVYRNVTSFLQFALQCIEEDETLTRSMLEFRFDFQLKGHFFQIVAQSKVAMFLEYMQQQYRYFQLKPIAAQAMQIQSQEETSRCDLEEEVAAHWRQMLLLLEAGERDLNEKTSLLTLSMIGEAHSLWQEEKSAWRAVIVANCVHLEELARRNIEVSYREDGTFPRCELVKKELTVRLQIQNIHYPLAFLECRESIYRWKTFTSQNHVCQVLEEMESDTRSALVREFMVFRTFFKDHGTFFLKRYHEYLVGLELFNRVHIECIEDIEVRSLLTSKAMLLLHTTLRREYQRMYSLWYMNFIRQKTYKLQLRKSATLFREHEERIRKCYWVKWYRYMRKYARPMRLMKVMARDVGTVRLQTFYDKWKSYYKLCVMKNDLRKRVYESITERDARRIRSSTLKLWKSWWRKRRGRRKSIELLITSRQRHAALGYERLKSFRLHQWTLRLALCDAFQLDQEKIFRRRVLGLWKQFRHRMRCIRIANSLNVQTSTTIRQKRFLHWVAWLSWHKHRVEQSVQLKNKNESIVMSRFKGKWLKHTQRLSTARNLCLRNESMRQRYSYQSWSGWMRRVKKQRQQLLTCNALEGRSTLIVRKKVWKAWKTCWTCKVQLPRLLNRVGSHLRTLYWKGWVRHCLRRESRKKGVAEVQAKISLWSRQRTFAQWVQWIHIKKEDKKDFVQRTRNAIIAARVSNVETRSRSGSPTGQVLRSATPGHASKYGTRRLR